MRRTQTMLTVAETLLASRSRRFWGYDLCKASGIESGSVYPMLAKFLNAGWIVDGWEKAEDNVPGRPPRRYYILTDDGARALQVELDAGRASGHRRDHRAARSPAGAQRAGRISS